MTLEDLREALPDYAKDTKLNLSSLMRETDLTDQQKYGVALACAYAIAEPQTLAAFETEAAGKLSPEATNAARAAASVMGMNNVYYRFVHLASAKDYGTMPAKLRMNVIGAPGIEKADFELYSMAVSAINGCGMCIDSHEAELRKHGLTALQVQAAVRLASVVNAAARTLAAETARRAAAHAVPA
jgi:lipoyl-dependent peroxiredoxin subunit D